MERPYTWSWVDDQVSRTIADWNTCAVESALHGPRYDPQEQQKRENAYDDALRTVERESKRASRNRAQRLNAQKRVIAVFPRFATFALGLEDDAVHLLADGFLPIGTQFAQWAKRFDPTLSMADTTQACRNAWTACGLQPLLGDRMQITPSILGYSLLYPYSDNYLDQQKATTAQKLDFSARFRDRLCGLRHPPGNRHETAVWAMVQLIEEQYPRRYYPQVFESLLAIHRAQECSIAQLKGCGSLDDAELIKISFAKGGTSVLADACLSHGSLDEEQNQFAFEWGVLLQLGDDLQDLRDDMSCGSTTLFTRAAGARLPLDSLLLQLLTFSEQVATRMDRLPGGSPMFKGLLRMSWRSLILMTAANTPELFTPRFLADLETRSPFRFAFLRARRKRLSGRSGLYKVLFEAFLEAGEVSWEGLPQPERWRECALAGDFSSTTEAANMRSSFA